MGHVKAGPTLTKLIVFGIILLLSFKITRVLGAEEEFELTPQDGYYNNLIHPDWGAVDGQLLRKSPVAYSDGVYEPSGADRPNPFEISRAAHHGPGGLASLRNRTAFMVFFGQQVVEEILDAQRPGCPREFFNVPVKHDVTPHLDPETKPNFEMPFLRSRYDQRTGYSPNNPRQQINEITPYIDGTLMYGPGKAWTDAIRELSERKPGRLKALDIDAPIERSFPAANDIRLPMANPPPPREHRLKPVSRFWRLGNPRGNENPFLLTFGVLWFRWHNYIADEIANEHPGLNDEQVFNLAKKKVIATHQNIVMYEWLPSWLKVDDSGVKFNMPAYNLNDPMNRYDPNVHPGITQEFQTAAMRFGHTLVTPGTWIRDESCNFQPLHLNVPGQPSNAHALRLCNSYWNPQEFLTSSEKAFDNMVLGLCSTLAEREDNIVVPDLREHVFGTLDFSRRDLMALNIQRARDHGLPDYNTIREAYGLSRKTSWEDINIFNISHADYPDGSYMKEVLLDFSLTVKAATLIFISGCGSAIPSAMDYNTIREAYGLSRRTSWEDINIYNISHADYPDGSYMKEPIRRVQELYGNTSAPDNLDLFSGGLLETTPDGPGELFRTIVLEQFLRIRHADRFWFENTNNGLFNISEIEEIRNITIRDIVLKVTTIPDTDTLNKDPFTFNSATDSCPQPEQLVADSGNTYKNSGEIIIENCTTIKYYDYFSGSEYSFAFTFVGLGLLVPGAIALMLLMAKLKQKQKANARKTRATTRRKNEGPFTHSALEWVGPKEGDRNVKIKFDEPRKKIHVTDTGGRKPLRMIDLRHTDRLFIRLSLDRMRSLLSIRVPGEIDLILRFPEETYRDDFVRSFDSFLQNIGIRREKPEMAEATILKEATTKEERKKILDKFIRVVCLQAFKKTATNTSETPHMDADTANQVSKIQLTRTEFADALGLKPTSLFVRNMFLMVDKDKNGFVGFQEFMDMFLVFARGGADEKARMMFNMYDLQGKGQLTAENFKKMIRGMLDMSDTSLEDNYIEQLLETLYKQAGLTTGQNMNFDAFKKIFASDEYEQTLEKATLTLQDQRQHNFAQSFRERRKTFIDNYNDVLGANGENRTQQRPKSHISVPTTTKPLPETDFKKRVSSFTKYVENYQRQIFWVTLYILVSIGIFVERAHYYSFEREHVGLRRVAGYGVTVTRGAASGMMWTYSCLLITMSRNLITYFRETFLHRFIPFDSFIAMHKFIASLALLFTVIHVIGHGINLYHISTWASMDLNCVFREYFRATDVLASFHYWAWTTITGLTGIVLTIIVIVMYVFAIPYARRNLFKAFWFTHSFYILLYIFMVMHGSGRLVQAPLTQNYLYGPLFVFVVDKLISFSRKKIEISVKKAELLPSDVLALTFKRPLNFEYRSGQWVRIACMELGENEYHPFTLTSAPHEEHLCLHIRAVGPWTMNIRKKYDINNRDGKSFPKLYLDGPFGEGHQDWYRYKVAVLVGGGIGVTPFASILKDIIFRSKMAQRFPCKKVYFLWVTRTQKHFEWLTDIIKEVEENDSENLVNVHIFITQFQQKFDLRTTMLYICERHFQKVCGKSLFTGLRAITHFGRPQFEDFLKSLHFEHPDARQIGVFSCGPPPMTLNVDRACTAMNKYEDFPAYLHHFENF